MTIPGRLAVGQDGKITGPIEISYNDPWPCVNGSWGSGRMQGAVMHTMVGDLPGTVQVFNTPGFNASAFFGIAQDGSAHQFGPVGKGWMAWAQMAGNPSWYSIEHADGGSPQNPLTDAQIAASAQLLELLSRFAGFPLQVTDSADGRGYGTHVMGGAAWGGHTCPGPGPRAAQREVIVELARLIQGPVIWLTTGRESLVEVAAERKMEAATILRLTAQRDGRFAPGLAAYIDGANLKAPMPAGLSLAIAAS